jgi:glycolate oxidase FAD binding subunit
MDKLLPRSAEELAATLADAAAGNRQIRLGGAFSKDRMAGPITPADVIVSTSAMTRILQYEPRDLTISVEAGMKWCDLTSTLAANRQMIPLDPPFFETATVGGVTAANTSGPRRRGFGTARDVVIGMKFATLQGKLVSSGGMVVKNVAGLDMAKLMIGSFGTLAGIGVVNFKLAPAPPLFVALCSP